MKTSLNEKVDNFFIKQKLLMIENINEVKDYGGLVHVTIHNKYSEANLKGKNMGYSFIYLAKVVIKNGKV